MFRIPFNYEAWPATRWKPLLLGSAEAVKTVKLLASTTICFVVPLAFVVCQRSSNRPTQRYTHCQCRPDPTRHCPVVDKFSDWTWSIITIQHECRRSSKSICRTFLPSIWQQCSRTCGPLCEWWPWFFIDGFAYSWRGMPLATSSIPWWPWFLIGCLSGFCVFLEK